LTPLLIGPRRLGPTIPCEPESGDVTTPLQCSSGFSPPPPARPVEPGVSSGMALFVKGSSSHAPVSRAALDFLHGQLAQSGPVLRIVWDGDRVHPDSFTSALPEIVDRYQPHASIMAFVMADKALKADRVAATRRPGEALARTLVVSVPRSALEPHLSALRSMPAPELQDDDASWRRDYTALGAVAFEAAGAGTVVVFGGGHVTVAELRLAAAAGPSAPRRRWLCFRAPNSYSAIADALDADAHLRAFVRAVPLDPPSLGLELWTPGVSDAE